MIPELGYIITYHQILWDLITYPCPKNLLAHAFLIIRNHAWFPTHFNLETGPLYLPQWRHHVYTLSTLVVAMETKPLITVQEMYIGQ